MNDWFRSWHGAPTDQKWRTIAKRAGVAPSLVVAVAWALMDRASQADDRGSVSGVDTEILSDFLDCDPGDIDRVITAMREKCVLTDERFTAWEKRQPKREREDTNSTDRVREHRRREKEERETREAEAKQAGNERASAATIGSAGAVTPCNATERSETPRVEQSRAERDSDTTLHDTAQADYGAIERELLDAADGKLNPARYPALKDLSPIIGLMDAGFDLRSEILPVVRAKARPGVRTWDYFVEATHESRARRLQAATERTRTPRPREGPSRAPSDTIHDPMIRAGAKYFTADP